MKYSIGIDIGGTNTVIGVVNGSGGVIEKATIKTIPSNSPLDLFNRLYDVYKTWDVFINDYEDLVGVGVGVPNGNYYTGFVKNPPNLGLEWQNVDLVSIAKNKFNAPSFITNDASAAATGELKFGKARSMNHAILITLGTGLGSGLIVNGEIVYGFDGCAGELGHMIVEENGRRCACGNNGCLEMYVSAKGLDYTVNQFKLEYANDRFLSSLPDQKIPGNLIDDAYDEGNELAKEIYKYTGKMLGIGLSQASTLLSPEAFIFYGGISKAEHRLLKYAYDTMNERILKSQKGNIKLLLSDLPDGDAGIVGSASLAW